MSNATAATSLFHLQEAALRLVDLISASEDGELDAALEKDLADHDARVEDKVEGYACLIGQLEAEAKARRAEANRIVELARADEALAEKLHDRLKEFFLTAGTAKMKTRTHNLHIKNAGGMLALAFVADVTEEFLVYTPSPNKDLIRQALDAGKELPFVSYAERKKVLVIR